MRSPDSYDTGECGWCGARDTVSMAITDRYQPTQQLTHASLDKRHSSDKCELCCVNIPGLLLDVETVFLITYCPVLSR